MESTKQSILIHEKAVLDIKFHPDGDIVFAASRDGTVSMSNTEGAVLGVFEGCNGSLSALDVENNGLMTGGFGMMILFFDILTGKEISKTSIDSVIRGIDYDGAVGYFSTDVAMNRECFIGCYDQRDAKKFQKLVSLGWPSTGLFRKDQEIIVSSGTGDIGRIDLRENKIIETKKIHQSKITSIRPSGCRSFFVTASKDSSSKIIDTETFSVKRCFEYGEPANSACIFRTNDIVAVSGGIDAQKAALTEGRGTFDVKFFDIVTQRPVGSYRPHFGTINAVDVHPQTTHCCTGGEDGTVSVIKFGRDFWTSPFTSFN
jgi:translation initiation factor 3 subunit I